MKTYNVEFWITSGWFQEVEVDDDVSEDEVKKIIQDNWDEYGNPYTVRPDMDIDYEIVAKHERNLSTYSND
jgi:hypothetical protein